jgi:hypothetical protein
VLSALIALLEGLAAAASLQGSISDVHAPAYWLHASADDALSPNF